MYFKSSLVTDGPYVQFNSVCPYVRGFPGGSVVKNPFANAGGPGGTSFIPGLGRSPGEGTGNPLKYSCLENSMDRRAWRATICGVAKSQTQCSNWALTHPHISRMVIFGLGFQDKLYPFALCRQKKTKTKTKTKKTKKPYRIPLYSIHAVVSVGRLCPTLLWPHGLQPTRLLCRWDFPGKYTEVGCHFLLWYSIYISYL